MSNQNESKTYEITPADCSLEIHTFSEKFMDTVVHFSTLKMHDSFFLWAGTTSKMPDMSLAMSLRMLNNPDASRLFGETDNQTSINLSKHLAKKTMKQVYASCNIPDDQLLVSAVEKRIAKEINDHPEKF
ncbi:proteasome assembly chaperone 4-like [Tubulanus polymorphus]|uniref:proteasome assembly chaperone 4-like n=1 Tax=Tubulanus polymorphus TaxID=672921 RepID=UPI003DA4F87E